MIKKNKSTNRSSTQNRNHSSKSSNNKFNKSNNRPKRHPNTNKSIWDKVGEQAEKLDYDPTKMSRLYHQLELKEELKEIAATRRQTSRIKATTKKKQTNIKYVPKKLILDDIREFRSSKIISSVSNSFAEFIVKTTAQTLDNSQKNGLRSVIALATSETLNKAFEKELSTLDKIKTFVKIGKLIYKIILWYDEKTQEYRTDENNIQIAKKWSFEYNWFLMRHQTLKAIYSNKVCLTLEDFNSGKICPLKKRLDKKNIMSRYVDSNTPNSCPYYYYCNPMI